MLIHTNALATIYLHNLPLSSIVDENNQTLGFNMMDRILGFRPGMFKPAWMCDQIHPALADWLLGQDIHLPAPGNLKGLGLGVVATCVDENKDQVY